MTGRRLVRLAQFALVIAILAYLAVDATLAWMYVHALTHPGCPSQPSQIPGVPAPEEYWLETHDGLRLRAWYYPSRNGAAIIALGGMGGALGKNLPPVEFLIREGFGVLQMDSRACARPAAVVTLGAEEAQDAAVALSFLAGRSEVKRIGAFGFSMGASAAVRAGARHEEIAAVVAEGGYFNLGNDFVEPDSRITIVRRAFLYTIAGAYWLQSGVNPWKVSPIEDIASISPRPVLLIYGEAEAESGRALAQFAAARDPKALWIVPGGAHGSNHATSPGEYERRVTEFFRTALGQ
jgi:fermentation-respiration switch protein FrsA (DUF1100 family)